MVDASTPESVTDACRRAVGTGGRVVLVAIAIAVALIAAVALGVALPPAERTFAAVSAPVQSLLSIFVPFFGVLLTSDLRDGRRPGPRSGLGPTWMASGLVAIAFGLVGIALSAAATAFGPGGSGVDRWGSAGLLVVGSLIMQLVAAGVGTASGLLVRPVPVAELATIVVPLGCYLLLGTAPVLRSIREWTTPFAAVQRLFSGRLTVLDWLQWAVVVAVWVVGSNVVGSIVHRRRGGRS